MARLGVRASAATVVIGPTGLRLQLIVVLKTGSVALLADTIHNFSDALTAVPLWVAFVLGRRAATAATPRATAAPKT